MWKIIGITFGSLLLLVLITLGLSFRYRHYTYETFRVVSYFFELRSQIQQDPQCLVPLEYDECLDNVIIQNGNLPKSFAEASVVMFFATSGQINDKRARRISNERCLRVFISSLDPKNMRLLKRDDTDGILRLEEKNYFLELLKKIRSLEVKRIDEVRDADLRTETVLSKITIDAKIAEFEAN